MPTPRRALPFLVPGRQIYRRKEARRQRAKRLRERFYQRSAICAVRNMAISRVEREWRIAVITGPDTRSLTGRLLGDPRRERSALWAKEQGWI